MSIGYLSFFTFPWQQISWRFAQHLILYFFPFIFIKLQLHSQTLVLRLGDLWWHHIWPVILDPPYWIHYFLKKPRNNGIKREIKPERLWYVTGYGNFLILIDVATFAYFFNFERLWAPRFLAICQGRYVTRTLKSVPYFRKKYTVFRLERKLDIQFPTFEITAGLK